jgi:hypothetical protein
LAQDISEIEAQVLEFREKDMPRNAPKYSAQIEEIQKQLVKLNAE